MQMLFQKVKDLWKLASVQF